MVNSVAPAGSTAFPAVALVVIEAEAEAVSAEAEASAAMIRPSVMISLNLADPELTMLSAKSSAKWPWGETTFWARICPLTTKSPLIVTKPLLSKVTNPAKKLIAPLPEVRLETSRVLLTVKSVILAWPITPKYSEKKPASASSKLIGR